MSSQVISLTDQQTQRPADKTELLIGKFHFQYLIGNFQLFEANDVSKK